MGEGPALCQRAGNRAVPGLSRKLCLAVMVMAVMMVLRRGKRGRGNHHNEQGGEQKFLHGCIVAPA